MRDKRRAGLALVVMGAALLAAALLLFLHNLRESETAGEAAGEALTQLQAAIEKTRQDQPQEQSPLLLIPAGTEPPMETTEPVAPTAPELMVATVDEHDYVGYLSIPALNRDLPVMKIAYEEDLQLAPCLQFGSPLTDDAVIAAHNYPSHFGPLKNLKGGEEVHFTTVDGLVIEYTVAEVRVISPDAVEEVKNSPHDLILYTCTGGGQERVMAACDRIAQN